MPEDQAETLQRLVNGCSTAQALYDSEINFEIAAFWDGGFIVKLGDALNGYRVEATLRTWEEVEPWLLQQAFIHYPDSAVAREHSRSNVVPLRSEVKKDPEAADRLTRGLGFDPNKPTG